MYDVSFKNPPFDYFLPCEILLYFTGAMTLAKTPASKIPYLLIKF